MITSSSLRSARHLIAESGLASKKIESSAAVALAIHNDVFGAGIVDYLATKFRDRLVLEMNFDAHEVDELLSKNRSLFAHLGLEIQAMSALDMCITWEHLKHGEPPHFKYI